VGFPLPDSTENRYTNLLADKLESNINSPNSKQIRQVAKQQNATLVSYSIIEGKRSTQESELYIWVVKPTGEVTFRQVELKSFLQKNNTSLTDFIASTRQSIGVSSGNIKSGIKVDTVKGNRTAVKLQQLHQILIQPIAELLPSQSNEHVIFIPQGSLFLVPFAALQDTNGKYLIEKHIIATAPSIQVLDLLYQRKLRIENSGLKDILVVGNPTMPKLPEELPQLPGAEQEAKAIARIFNTQALTGNAATETTVVERMSQAKIIHLATVALPHDKQRNSDALALAPSGKDDGWLKSEEILNLNLKAELVVLSAGNTALGKITGDGVIGLSRSFFSAGVSTVVGSLWDVSDSSTKFLMTDFYENLQKNPDKAAALRQGMLATMKKYPHPRDWAAFTLIGVSS
jgi:CHAT domain-containing protein